jgi:predicted nucleic acid-binding protein
MRYWDSSAIVALLVREPASDAVLAEYEREPDTIVWWASSIECVSALSRLEREDRIEPADMRIAIERLEALAGAWTEVAPTDRVRRLSVRLLRVHPLRAADALQLAAAIVAAEEQPSSLDIVTLDTRLAAAAEREGFVVVAPAA